MAFKFNPLTGKLDYYEKAGAAANGLPVGGTTNQVLAKNSNTDYDASWVAPGSGGLTNPVDHLDFNLSYTPTGSEPAGSIFWDAVDGTYDMKLLNGATLQVGQELHFYGKADGAISNGDLCQFAGVQGDHILIKKAVGSEIDANPEYLVGIATQNITNGSFGYVTWFGKVNGVFTTGWTVGDLLYFNVATGQLQNTVPDVPKRVIIVAAVIKEATGASENGIILVRPTFGKKITDLDDVNGTALTTDGQMLTWHNTAGYFDFDKNINDYIPKTQNVLLKEPTGFTAPESVIVTYDSAARTITLTGTVQAYFQGEVVSALVSGWVSAAHTATASSWFLFYNGSSFVWQQTPWTFDMLQIAYVNYGATDKFSVRETHGLMQWQSHHELHDTIGTYLDSGGDLTSWLAASTTVGDRRPTVSSTVIKDEDLATTNAILSSDLYTHLTLTTTGVSTFAVDQAEIVPVLANNPYYNSFTTPNWTQTLMANNSYMSVWLVALPAGADATSQKYRYIWLQGQSNGTLASQQALTPGNLSLGTLASISPEFVFIGKIIIRYTGGNWVITSVEKLTTTKAAQAIAIAGLQPIYDTVGIVIDGGGSVITTGTKKAVITMNGSGTFTGWNIVADQTGSIVVDVKSSTYAGFPTTASIAGTEKPTLASARKNQDLTLSTWTTSYADGDKIEFNVDSCSTITAVTITLNITRN